MSLREKLADLQHEIWSRWMRYMFTQGMYMENGNWIMPAEKVKRWQRQMSTPYLNLTRKEQLSDLEQADKVIRVITK